MDEKVKMIASRIRELRDLSGVSLESLSREFGIDVPLYRQYEEGSADIPIGFLFRLSQRFEVDLTTLITGEEPHLKKFSVIRKGKGLVVERRKEYGYQDLSYNFIPKKAEVFIVTVEPGKGDGPLQFNTHPGQEFGYVLSGSLLVVIDGHDTTLEEGDFIYFDSGAPHAVKAVGGVPARFLAAVL